MGKGMGKLKNRKEQEKGWEKEAKESVGKRNVNNQGQ